MPKSLANPAFLIFYCEKNLLISRDMLYKAIL